MQINPVNNNFKNFKKEDKQSSGPAFKNAAGFLPLIAKPLQSFDSNPISGVIFLDVTSAIAPNTAIDTVKRNPDQGFETFRRESSGLIVNCIVPGVGVVGVSYLLKNGILGDAFSKISAHKIWANKDTIDESTAQWKKLNHISDKKEKINMFVNEMFKNVQANEHSIYDEKQRAEKKAITLKKLSNAIYNASENKVDIPHKTLVEVHDELAVIYGQSKSIKVKGSTKEFSTGMKNYVRDTFALSKAFMDKSVTHQNIDTFATKLKKLLVVKSVVTMAAVGALALSMQTINRKITEKLSGRKGYSGYKDLSGTAEQTPEDKKKLTMGKLASSAWFASLAFVSMGKFSGDMLNFAAPTTTMNQARSLSLLTDIGRVNAADDKNELKDTTVRDTIIFSNLYVLGDYVQKGVVEIAQRYYKNKGQNLNLMNEAEKSNPNDSVFKKLGKWIKGKSVKSFQEIEGTKSLVSTQTRKNIVTAGNFAGIAYSLVALGIFTPLYIARMTNNSHKRQLSKSQQVSQGQAQNVENNPRIKLKS